MRDDPARWRWSEAEVETRELPDGAEFSRDEILFVLLAQVLLDELWGIRGTKRVALIAYRLEDISGSRR